MAMHVVASGRGGGRDHIDGMKHRSDLALLHRSDLFRDLPFEVLGEIRSLASLRQAASGHVVFHQGDDAATLYIVLDGRFRSAQVTPEGEQVIIRYLGPGELMGFAVLAGQETCATTVTALMESSLLAWSGPMIEQIIRRYPVVATNALLVIGRRYQEILQRLRELSTQGVERRIAHTLLRLARQAGRRTARGIEIAFPISRRDLGEMSGTTLHTVSRTLSAWESRGLLSSGRRRIVVQDMQSLSRVAEEEA